MRSHALTVGATRCDVQYIFGHAVILSASQWSCAICATSSRSPRSCTSVARPAACTSPSRRSPSRSAASRPSSATELLRRSRRRVELTEPGRLLLEHARPLLADADGLERLVRRAAGGEVGRLAVGFVGSATYRALPALVRAFRDRLPEVDLVLSELTTTPQVAALRARQIDVGIVRPPSPRRASCSSRSSPNRSSRRSPTPTRWPAVGGSTSPPWPTSRSCSSRATSARASTTTSRASAAPPASSRASSSRRATCRRS